MIERRNYKFILPDYRTVDIISDVVIAMYDFRQISSTMPEAGGLLLGYVDAETSNETISALTLPQKGDLRTQLFFGLKDGNHYNFLNRAKRKKNYFMGTWHTHPQDDPSPSSTDWKDWHQTLACESSSQYSYAYFVIIGIDKMRIWVGDFISKNITELVESDRMGLLYSEHPQTK